jgi:leucyl aminopeptidase
MGDMKGDMGGAAMVIATMYLVKKLNLQVNLVGLVFACENMPDAGAYKPGDVVTAMNGTTIEITNTDAEGRLVLADALCYSQKFSPELIFDFATLTGAIVSALGHNYTGIFTNNEYSHTLSEVMHAGKKSKHKVWRLPLDKEHTEALKSDIADISHTGASSFGAGSSTAAAFLKEFVPEKAEWIHFDIAGTAMKRGKMADGSPFPLIGHFLLDQSL